MMPYNPKYQLMGNLKAKVHVGNQLDHIPFYLLLKDMTIHIIPCFFFKEVNTDLQLIFND